MSEDDVQAITAAVDRITALRGQLSATEDNAAIDRLQDELARAYWPLCGNQSEDPTATGSAYGWLRQLLQERTRYLAVVEAAKGVRDYSGAMNQFLQSAIPSDEHAQGVMLRAAEKLAALNEAVARLEGE